VLLHSAGDGPEEGRAVLARNRDFQDPGGGDNPRHRIANCKAGAPVAEVDREVAHERERYRNAGPAMVIADMKNRPQNAPGNGRFSGTRRAPGAPRAPIVAV